MGGIFHKMPESGKGKFICEALLRGETADKIACALRKVYPTMTRPRRRISWFKCQMRKVGLLPPSEKK